MTAMLFSLRRSSSFASALITYCEHDGCDCEQPACPSVQKDSWRSTATPSIAFSFELAARARSALHINAGIDGVPGTITQVFASMLKRMGGGQAGAGVDGWV